MVYQENDLTCGNSCVRNILNIVSKKNIFSTYHIKDNLDTFTKIKNELFKHGLVYQGYKVNNLSIINRDKLPAIIQVYNGTKFHFIILYSIKKRIAKIIDPQFGKIKIKIEKLKFIFTGKILLLEKKNKINEKKSNLQFINTYTSLQFIIVGLIQLFTTSLFFHYLLFDPNYLIKFFYGISSLLSILLHNLLNLYTRNKLNIIFDTYSLKSNNKEDVICLSKVLDNEVTIISSSISYLNTIIICIFILSHSFLDSIIFLITIISFLFKIYLVPFINNIKRENSYYEDIAFTHLETDKKSFKSFMSSAKKISYKFLMFNLMPYLCLITLDILYILVGFFLIEGFDSSKIFYYIFISFFIFTLLNKLIQSFNKKENTYIELNKMSLSIKSFSLKKKNIIYYNSSEDNLKENNNE